MTQPYRIQMHETGGPDVLKVEDFIPRKPGPGEVTVRQSAAGLNFIDTYHRTGLYPVRFPFTPGQEGAGPAATVKHRHFLWAPTVVATIALANCWRNSSHSRRAVFSSLQSSPYLLVVGPVVAFSSRTA